MPFLYPSPSPFLKKKSFSLSLTFCVVYFNWFCGVISGVWLWNRNVYVQCVTCVISRMKYKSDLESWNFVWSIKGSRVLRSLNKYSARCLLPKAWFCFASEFDHTIFRVKERTWEEKSILHVLPKVLVWTQCNLYCWRNNHSHVRLNINSAFLARSFPVRTTFFLIIFVVAAAADDNAVVGSGGGGSRFVYFSFL